VITIGLDRDAEKVRPFIEKAKPTHPSLIDTEWTFADLYNIVNVPEALWIDEEGQIVRPNDAIYVTGEYRRGGTGVDPAAHRARIRRWVKEGLGAMSADEVRRRQRLPNPSHQQARAEFALGVWLVRHASREAAEPHFVTADELAPEDFTIRRGSMPFRGLNWAGEPFMNMVRDWREKGHYYYEILQDDPVPEDADRS
jgi:hypothetical protein